MESKNSSEGDRADDKEGLGKDSSGAVQFTLEEAGVDENGKE